MNDRKQKRRYQKYAPCYQIINRKSLAAPGTGFKHMTSRSGFVCSTIEQQSLPIFFACINGSNLLVASKISCSEQFLLSRLQLNSLILKRWFSCHSATLADSGALFKFLNGAINGRETILWQKLALMAFLLGCNNLIYLRKNKLYWVISYKLWSEQVGLMASEQISKASLRLTSWLEKFFALFLVDFDFIVD